MSNTLLAGSPWRAILSFTIPLLIGNAVQQMYQVVDTMVVGRHLGVNSLAAVGATGSLTFFLIGFAMGMTAGFAIPAAQAFGSGNSEAVRRSVATGAILTGITSLIFTVGGPFISEPLLRLLNTPDELIPEATAFLTITFLGSAGLMFFNFLSSVIRAIGDSKTPLYFLVLACVLNVILVLVFVGVIDWGVGGAAAATVISQAVSVLLCLVYIRSRLPELRLKREHWKPLREVYGEHLRLGLPMGFQSSIIAIGSISVQVRLNSLGSDAVAAYTTGSRLDSLAVSFLASLGLATSMFVAQNLGARQGKRILQGVKQSVLMGLAGSIIIGAILIVFGHPLVALFIGTSEPTVNDMAVQVLIINGSTYVFLGTLMVLRGALQGLGDAVVPTISGILELVGRVVAAILFGALWGYVGVLWSNPLAWLGATIILVPAFLRARKSLAKMRAEGDGSIGLTMTTPVAVVGPHEGSMVVDSVLTQPVAVVTATIAARARARKLRKSQKK